MSIPQILKMLGILFFGCAMSAGATTPTTTTSKKHSSGTVHASGKAKAKSGASHTASTKSKSAHVAVTSHRSGHGAKAKLAVQIFTRSVKKAIGGFVARVAEFIPPGVYRRAPSNNCSDKLPLLTCVITVTMPACLELRNSSFRMPVEHCGLRLPERLDLVFRVACSPLAIHRELIQYHIFDKERK